MSRADRLTLSAEGLDMPAVDHLSNRGALNVLLDRTVAGVSYGIPSIHRLIGLFMNFVRLTDKALREYDAARAEVISYIQLTSRLRKGAYLRAIDHMENCVSATHRAALNAKALRTNRIGRSAPRLTELQEERLAHLRNAVEHSDERLLGPRSKTIPAFHQAEPYSLRLANTSMVIGNHVLTYRQLLTAMTKTHRAVEVIRGVETGTPGPQFPNAKLRTQVDPPAATADQWRPSEYLRELSRLVVTH